MRILIADDHALVRKGLRQLLAEALPQVEFGEASNAQEALDLVWGNHWNVLLLDITMPGRSGLDLLKQLKQDRPELPVLVLSAHPEEDYALRVLKAGAAGFLNKDAAVEELLAAIRKVVAGGKYVSPSVGETLAESVETLAPHPRHEDLSDREFEVFRLLASGKAVSEIAAQLSLSVKTISTYRTRLLQKLHVKGNAELIRYAVQHRLTDLVQ
jgi:DNA-binding NarL/FixJ family response regulator